MVSLVFGFGTESDWAVCVERLFPVLFLEARFVSVVCKRAMCVCLCRLHSYFEEKGKYDKAVQLYHKGGNMTRALEMCFKAQLFDDLRAIGACVSCFP